MKSEEKKSLPTLAVFTFSLLDNCSQTSLDIYIYSYLQHFLCARLHYKDESDMLPIVKVYSLDFCNWGKGYFEPLPLEDI